MHSATKFIAGHSDVMAGVLAVKGERWASSLCGTVDNFCLRLHGTGVWIHYFV